MIGYIKIFKPELKVKNLQIYESYYCGVCKSLKTRYGLFKNMTLNNDAVFVSLLIDSLKNNISNHKPFRCAYNPIKKRVRVVNESTDFASDVNIYLMYKKLIDDFNDEKKIISLIGSTLIKGSGKKASKNIGSLKDIIDKNLDSIYSLEKEKCSNSNDISNLYGNIIEQVCNIKFKDNLELFKISSCIGYNIGKWVYLIDAYDDIIDDVKNNSYNPYILEYNYKSTDDIYEFKERIKSKVKTQLFKILDKVVIAYELVDENAISPIIYNIILDGIYNTTNTVLEGKCNHVKNPI